ncbi:MAG: methyl-accepting chemotaxis protein, partial [Spirochaetales bacterium]|nr:methyl-accepting chemotaxis protein [Spirochaetales bacterium]
LWINAPVFDKGKPIGMLGTGIDLTAFIDTIYKSIEGDAIVYLFNRDGEITAAQDSSLVVQKKNMTDQFGETGKTIRTAAESLTSTKIESFDSDIGQVAIGFIPVLDWYMSAYLPFSIGEYLASPMTGLFAAMILVVIVIFIIFNIFIRNFLRPLDRVVTLLKEISADWDLTRRLKIKAKDEIGNMADFLNLTFEKIMELLQGIKGQTASLSATGEELAGNMGATAGTINNITSNIQNMRGQVSSQAEEVAESGIALEHIMAAIEKLGSNIAVQAESVDQSSSAIEEMIANIHSVTETLVKNSANINSLSKSSETGRVDLQAVAEDIQKIAKESEGLLEINEVMQNIASQTNLLSMNAAIEAAHAGESGKGFAVVADEIRKLAENSAEQSKTISAVLKKIKESIDIITKSTEVVLTHFEAIEQEVKTVSTQESHIRSAMEEQETGSKNILDAITQLNSATSLVKTASDDMTAESRAVIKQSENLKRITAEVSGGMEEVSRGAEQIDVAVNRVNEISSENKNNIESLSLAVGKFKVE